MSATALWAACGAAVCAADRAELFEIQVVDEATGRGVPLVELETVNHVLYVTDSAGRAAIEDPGLLGQETFFHVRSHGYEYPVDGFGSTGVRFVLEPGGRQVVRVQRKNVAERIYRLTGEGVYRDSVLLGYEPPIAQPVNNAGVVGQDSTLAAVYDGKVHWIWGDTSLARYPLGVFRATGAVSDLPENGGLNPAVGVNLRYYTGEQGLARKLCPLDDNEPHVVWLDGLVSVPDKSGRERLVAHYSRRPSLAEQVEHGIAVWNDERQVFERARRLDADETWRHLQGHPNRWRDGDVDYVLCGETFMNVRVPATYEAVLDPAQYEAWNCTAALGTDADETAAVPARDDDGRLAYSWQSDRGPMTRGVEARWLRENLIERDEAWQRPVDVESGDQVTLHRGSIRYNEHRGRWIMIAVQQGGTSYLGEVWYSEADSPLGPWRRARKIVTHDRYTFYNPVQHTFFDQDGGRVVYFDGTYATTFSGNDVATPRYDYNLVMYRLDLDADELQAVRETP